ncbi:MAG: four helix bundle protein, partial [Nitrospira sp.]|nr:four helix bundle protein [Nitrospira sp.]
MRNFRELEVWKLGKKIVLDVYRVTKDFPKEEMYGLVAQMRRAAVSIPSNVAEGFNRKHNPEYRQLLYVALGSCAELETQIEVAHDLG